MDDGLRRALLVVATLGGAVLLLVLLGGVFMVLMMAMMGGMMGDGMGGGMMGSGMMGLMLLVGLFVIVGLALLVVWAMRQGTGRGARRDVGHGDEALSTLQRRYAAGEITREQYQQMLEDLEAREHRRAP